MSPWDFPGRPVVKTSCFTARGTGSIPGWGAKILRATQCGQKNKKRMNPCLCSGTWPKVLWTSENARVVKERGP